MAGLDDFMDRLNEETLKGFKKDNKREKVKQDLGAELEKHQELKEKENVNDVRSQFADQMDALAAQQEQKEVDNMELESLLEQKILEQQEMTPARQFARTADAVLGTKLSDQFADKTAEYGKMLSALSSKEGANAFKRDMAQSRTHEKISRLTTGNMRGSVVGKLATSIHSLSLTSDRIKEALANGGVFTKEAALQISTAWSAGEQLGSPSFGLIKDTGMAKTFQAYLSDLEKWSTGKIPDHPVINMNMLKYMEGQLEVIKKSRFENKVQESANLINTAGATVYPSRPELLDAIISTRSVLYPDQEVGLMRDPEHPGRVIPRFLWERRQKKIQEQAVSEVKKKAKKVKPSKMTPAQRKRLELLRKKHR